MDIQTRPGTALGGSEVHPDDSQGCMCVSSRVLQERHWVAQRCIQGSPGSVCQLESACKWPFMHIQRIPGTVLGDSQVHPEHLRNSRGGRGSSKRSTGHWELPEQHWVAHRCIQRALRGVCVSSRVLASKRSILLLEIADSGLPFLMRLTTDTGQRSKDNMTRNYNHDQALYKKPPSHALVAPRAGGFLIFKSLKFK